ncbi:methyltransferase domain-containing protein [Lignipirellula cremea]|uniref:Demethylmenaquinone methyltransferase n=1 Tax=Lignipirellula cremea TaxID=2528010 RepID=A0A518DWT0_9BACT|nr:methyltransferase domain-containing protein [Lignipirellula cremea]QDU96292.1 Demethylmenaquinone methyltransferase [Lignipirellula cremea]
MTAPSQHGLPREGSDYVIHGGVAGRERLRALSRVLERSSKRLLRKAGVGPGAFCLDVGCGGGDISLLMSRMVGPTGRVLGVDIDDAKLALARNETDWRKRGNLQFQLLPLSEIGGKAEFDFAYSRFLLSHLREPAVAVEHLRNATLPQGAVIVEDIDFRGHFCYPACPAFDRYVELYQAVVHSRGGDPNIGPRLPELLEQAGLSHVRMNLVQPAGNSTDVKYIAACTLENISDALIAEKIAGPDEIDSLAAELREFAADSRSILSLPRIIQAWGYRA